MFDPKSDYALNKMAPDAIIYTDSNGVLIRLTSKDFASLEEFLRWKNWSDENYHQTENESISFSKRTLSTTGLSERSAAVQSPEDALVEAQEQKERRELCSLLMAGVDTCLTPTQRRRLWLYCVEGMTEDAIAAAENVKQQSISECLQRVKEKLKKFLNSPL